MANDRLGATASLKWALDNKDRVIARLLSRRLINTTNGCWEWVGATNDSGYGIMNVGGRRGSSISVSRVAAVVFGIVDPASGLCACHYCDNPKCFNPEHLWAGTNKENCIDRDRKGRLGDRKGSHSGRAILDEHRVRDVRAVLSAGAINKSALGRLLGVSQRVIYNIQHGKTWTHV